MRDYLRSFAGIAVLVLGLVIITAIRMYHGCGCSYPCLCAPCECSK
jgi:hypothetical protein